MKPYKLLQWLLKEAEGVNTRALSEFKFIPLNPVVENSLATHLEDETTKAKTAYEKFGNTVAVTFNDLAVATLAKNGAFQSAQFAKLTLASDINSNIRKNG